MQAPNPAQAPYQPPQPPQIPLQAIQSLIPRLTATINEIDKFQHTLAQGAQNGTLPEWEKILQRYSLLQGRINALQTYLARPPVPQPGQPSPTGPALTQYLVHPLHALPSDAQPLAKDIFFEALNTLSLPPLSDAQTELLSKPPWISADDVKRADEGRLEGLRKDLIDRAGREERKAKRIAEEVEKREEEVDWAMRIGAEEEEDLDEEKDDLFGDQDGDAAVGAAPREGPNLREGWGLADYVRHMDMGKEPVQPG